MLLATLAICVILIGAILWQRRRRALPRSLTHTRLALAPETPTDGEPDVSQPVPAPEAPLGRTDGHEARPAAPSPRTRPLDTQECRVAVHEAGHATIAWSCTHVQNISRITIDHPNGGRVEYTATVTSSADGLWCQLVVLLAGIAAEVAVYGRVRVQPAAEDLMKALATARVIIEQGADAEPPWESSVDDRSLPFGDVYRQPLSVREAAVIGSAYLQAKSLIHAHEYGYYRLVSLLLHRRTVDQADLAPIFGSRAFIRIVGIVRPTFIVPKAA